MDWKMLSQFVDANKIGGWVRAGVAAIITVAIGRWPWLGKFLDPVTQQAIGVAVAGVAVGIWSQLTKTPEAKIAAVVDLAKDSASPVQGIITTNSPEGRGLAASIPGPIESAGSSAATEIAKS